MSIKVKGLDKAIRDLIKKGQEGEEIVKDYLDRTATDIELKAIQLAPASIGGEILNIKERINKVPSNGGLTWKVGVEGSEFIDGWVEFGTGQDYLRRVSSDPRYTQEIRDLAYKFYKNGLGTLPGRPYLFPAYFQYTANLVEDLKKELKKLG